MKVLLLMTLLVTVYALPAPVQNEDKENKRFLLDNVQTAAGNLAHLYQDGGVIGLLTGLTQTAQHHLDQIKQAVQTAAGTVTQLVHQAGSSSKRFLLDDVQTALGQLHEQYQSGGLTGVLGSLGDVVKTQTDHLKQAVQTLAGTADQVLHQVG